MLPKQFYEIVDTFAPKAISDEYCSRYGAYDNSGLLVDCAEEITGAVFALDLTDGAIAHSGVWMQRMDNSTVLQVKDFLQKIIEIDGQMAAMPSDGFFKAL